MTIYHTITTYQFEDYIEIFENQTVIIDFKIRDDSNTLYTPTVLRWQLTNLDGDVINSRAFSVDQTTVDEIVLDYDDTTITDNEDELLLSIAAGVTISGTGVQQNSQIKIKLKNLVSTFPKLFEEDTLDDPFRDLDSPFTELDETF